MANARFRLGDGRERQPAGEDGKGADSLTVAARKGLEPGNRRGRFG